MTVSTPPQSAPYLRTASLTPWQRVLALGAGTCALLAALMGLPDGLAGLWLIGFGLAGTASLVRFMTPVSYVTDGALAMLGAAAVLAMTGQMAAGEMPNGFWLALAATWLFAWLFVDRMANALAARKQIPPGLGLIIPLAFGATLLLIWEAAVRGLGVPAVLLPAPSQILARIAASAPTLWADFQQTFLKSVLAGYAIGCLAGFAVAVLVDRSPFLKRGLLPIGNFASALPIIGIAPIMVMWFGFDWQSKAAVIVCIIFFPMLVNTLAGLNAAGRMESDLMRTYAASSWQTLFKLRLPAAAPFIFNALKINSTLALIGAIVAEFFGTPIVGMGFRIATEVGRLNADMVWAEVAIAALAGSAFYGVVALIERAVTFWHPSIRNG